MSQKDTNQKLEAKVLDLKPNSELVTLELKLLRMRLTGMMKG